MADYARGYLDVTLGYRQLRDVLSWGLTDRYSRIEGFEPRAGGARRRPTLYDAKFRAKSMRDALAARLLAGRRAEGLRTGGQRRPMTGDGWMKTLASMVAAAVPLGAASAQTPPPR